MTKSTHIPTAITLKPDHITKLSDTQGMALAFWLSSLLKSTLTDTLVVVVTPDLASLARLETELGFFGIKANVFADYETLPYDRLSVHQDVVAERIGLLTHIPKTGVLLVSVQTLMGRIAPPAWLLGQHFELSVGERFNIEDQRQRLISAGYTLTDNVFEAGEFAIRGGIVDMFVVGQVLPFRLQLLDDEIESIKFFSPETQRTLSDDNLAKLKKDSQNGYNTLDADKLPSAAKPKSFIILPAKEFPLEEGKETFRQNFASMFADVSARKVEFYQDVMNGIMFSGIEYYAPLFFDLDDWQASGSLFAYLPKNTLFVTTQDLKERHDAFWQQTQGRYRSFRHDKAVPILSPELLYLPSNEFFAKLKAYPRAVFGVKDGQAPFTNAHIQTPPLLSIDHKKSEPLSALLDFIKQSQKSVLITPETAGRREIILELLAGKIDAQVVANFDEFLANKQQFCTTKVALTVAPLEQGLVIDDEQGGFCVVSETQIFGRQILQTRKRKSSGGIPQEFLVKSVTELNQGSLVVHIEHGIGRYQGLVVLDVGGGEQEFIHLKYADDASIYVPITNLALIGRYSGTDSEAVALSKLGSGKWDKAKLKTLEQIHDVAAELLNVQARRNAKQGISFPIDMTQYELFASGFMYEETPDQALAIESVLFDMKQSKPMDRLICGDVGFGKTEVAMRAAFVAVQAGYQVALLVPTTLLAGQHEDSFRNRFADHAVRIESLSRFGTKKHHDKVLDDLAQGKVDIIIGTHRLLQDDVRFRQLGLLIVDEEHRFGVRHKQKIKTLQANIDTLAMTATPIPRTLNMALSGMQDISVIATPPARRLAIKTFVVEKNEQVIKEAVLREILRGGQAYFLHNDVASIEAMAETLGELIVEARVGVAHGQMPEKELSAVMSDFYHKKFNVLVASTIIETGIDVATANTIIINRADKFGLAQLHQLRGRVGRSYHQAYCYLLVPSIKGLTADAKKRLDAITKANTLGAGFMLASEDLEIRGAGEILGKEQSGNMQAIGFGLYMDMLERATRAIKAGKIPSLTTALDLVSDINIHASALIPDEYLGDVHERLLFYKRIGNADDLNELIGLRTELIDRFGVLPVQAQNLFDVHKLRILSKPFAISKIDVSETNMLIEFKPDTPVDALTIINLVQSKDGYRMNGGAGLKRTFSAPKNAKERILTVLELLDYLKK